MAGEVIYFVFGVPSLIGMIGSLLLFISTLKFRKEIQKWPRLIMLCDFIYTTAVVCFATGLALRAHLYGVFNIPVWLCFSVVYPHVILWMPLVIATLHVVISIDRLLATLAPEYYFRTSGAVMKEVAVFCFAVLSIVMAVCIGFAAEYAFTTDAVTGNACGPHSGGYKQVVQPKGVYIEVMVFVTAVVASCIQFVVFLGVLRRRNKIIASVGGLHYAKKQARLTKTLLYISVSFLILFTVPSGIAAIAEVYKDRHNLKGILFQLSWFMQVLHACSNWVVFLRGTTPTDRIRIKAFLCCHDSKNIATALSKSSVKNPKSEMKTERK